MSKPAEERTYAPVRVLMLYLTEDCNLRCTYCFVEKEPRRMSAETARKSVDFFLNGNVAAGSRRVTITFFGGEPFLELDRMTEVVAYARRPRGGLHRDLSFSATTNGTVASPRAERVIREAAMHVLLSVDGGPGDSRHRPLVSGRSSYELVARNMPKFLSWSPAVMVRVTFHPESFDLVEKVRAVLDLGAPAIALCPVLERSWQGLEERLDEAYQALARWYVEEARRGRTLPLEVTNVMLRQFHHVKLSGSRPARPCGVGTWLLGVDPDGHVMPCHRFLYRPQDWLGSVDDTSLPDRRWRYVHIASRDFPGCDRCVAEPVCGGGCRAVALNASLGLHDPFENECRVTRAQARAVYHIYDTLMAERNPTFLAMLGGANTAPSPLLELATR